MKRMKENKGATDWEKIFANNIYDTGFIPRIYRELSKLMKKQGPKKGKNILIDASPRKIYEC